MYTNIKTLPAGWPGVIQQKFCLLKKKVVVGGGGQ